VNQAVAQSTEAWRKVLAKPKRKFRLGLERVLAQSQVENVDALIKKTKARAATERDRDRSFALDLLRSFSSPYSTSIDFSKDNLELNTDDFVDLTMDFAEEVGIDLKRFAVNLTSNEDASEYVVGVALRTMFEIEGHYVEIPHAFTVYKVPKQFLIVLGAAIIGIATAKAYELDPILAGSIGGVGSLLINILAARYLEKGKPQIDWIEELVLQVLEEYGIQSFKELKQKTHIHPPLLKKVLKSLVKQDLVKEHRSWIDKTDLRYDLSGHH
jgi:hypothetical protein